MYELFDKLPGILQAAAFLGVAGAVFVLWLVGRRQTGAGDSAEEEIKRLTEQLLDQRFEGLRRDLQLVIATSRTAMSTELNTETGALHRRINALQTRVENIAAVLHHQGRNPPGE